MEYPHSLLLSVSRPAQYVGGEFNQPALESDPDLSVCLAYPDTYDVGMSYAGLVILYHLLNDTSGIRCERSFAPWLDMEAALRDKGLPLLSLETGTPLREFDLLGFSLQYDLCFTNILTMLDLGGIPLRAADRSKDDPWVIAGGPCAVNPEPLAEFVDAFCIGDGEEAIVEIADRLARLRKSRAPREEIRKALAGIEGAYVPHLYEPVYGADGILEDMRGREKKVRRRIVDPETAYYPTRPLVPHIMPIHDRCTLEARRGCARGCRFCQAGYITRPVRERSPRTMLDQAASILSGTGYDEVGLIALSIGDYSEIESLSGELRRRFEPRGISLALPSLRVDAFDSTLARDAARVRRTSLTFAPEVGTEKMRRVVNKSVGRDDMVSAIEAASGAGFDLAKVYFMVGLPFEEMEDLEGIIDLVKDLRGFLGSKRKRLNVSIAGFVPKPHTPFQWTAQLPRTEMEERMLYLKRGLGGKGITTHYHDPEQSFLEAVFARGDRRLGRVLGRAHALGCRLDQWGDTFDLDRWLEAFRVEGVDPDFYALRERQKDEVFPWDPVDVGVSREFLWAEWERAQSCATTPDCTLGKCAACGVCDNERRHLLAAPGKWQRPNTEEQGLPPQVHPRRDASSSEDVALTRIRLEYSRGDPLTFVGHRDFQDGIQKLFRRAEIPVALTKGYNPRPRIVFAFPLPVGEEAEADLLEAVLEEEAEHIDPDAVVSKLNEVAQPGLRFSAARVVDSDAPKITALLQAVRYRVDVRFPAALSLPETVKELEARWEELLPREEIAVKRRRKGTKGDREVDLRPFLSSFEVEQDKDGVFRLRFEFAIIDGGTPRIDEVLEVMLGGEDFEVVRVVRGRILLIL